MIVKGRPGTRGDRGPHSKACTWCTARLIWAPDPAGTRVALDATPSPDGLVVLYPRPGQADMAVELTRAAAAAHRASGRPTYRRHATSCPYAHQWSTPTTGARR